MADKGMQPVSITTETNQKPLTMAMIMRGVIYNEITPEIQEFLDKNGIVIDRAVQLKFKDGTKVSYTEQELNELDAFDQLGRIGSPYQSHTQTNTAASGKPNHADV